MLSMGNPSMLVGPGRHRLHGSVHLGRRSAQLVPNLDCDDGEGWLDEHRGSTVGTVGMVACTSARTVAGMSGVGDGDVRLHMS